MLAVVPFTLAAPRLASDRPPSGDEPGARRGGAGERISAPHEAAAGRCCIPLTVLLYRWPDGLLGLMVVPFLIQKALGAELIGTVQAGWGQSPHHGRHGLGGVPVLRALA